MKKSVSNRYSPGYKIEAVELAKTLGNITKAAEEKGVHQNTLRRWQMEFDKGLLKDDIEEATINPLPLIDNPTDIENLSQRGEDNTQEMVENTVTDAPQEVQGSSEENNKYEVLYYKTKKEVDHLIQVNSELNKELSEAQISIGELFTQIRKLKKNS